MSVGGGVARSYVYTDHYAYYEPHIRVCNMHIMHIKSTSEAVSRTSYWLSANQDSIARSHYAEGSLVSSLFFSSISYATSETASHCTVVAYLVVWIHVTCNMGMHTYSPGTFRKKERYSLVL